MNVEMSQVNSVATAQRKDESASKLRAAFSKLWESNSFEPLPFDKKHSAVDVGKIALKEPQRQRARRVSNRLIATSRKKREARNRRAAKLKEAAVPFPVKLHDMLENIEDRGLSSIVSWQPHGRAIKVHKPKEFVEEVLPLYFRQTKITSFQRQLNVYGFERIVYGPDSGSYYHGLFLRRMRFLSFMIARVSVKGTGTRKTTCLLPEQEPNFYAMPPLEESARIAPYLIEDKALEVEQVLSIIMCDVLEEGSTQQEEGGNATPKDIEYETTETCFNTCRACMEDEAVSDSIREISGCAKSHEEGDKIVFEGKTFCYMKSRCLHDAKNQVAGVAA